MCLLFNIWKFNVKEGDYVNDMIGQEFNFWYSVNNNKINIISDEYQMEEWIKQRWFVRLSGGYFLDKRVSEKLIQNFLV